MNNRVENVCGKCWTPAVGALLGLAWFASAAQANFTVDRDYRLGDDSAENATAGATIAANRGSFDSFTPFVDLQAASGGPIYTTITGRPDGGTGLGVAFDGSLSQFLRGFRLGDPGTSKSSSANVGGTIAYQDTHDRGMQFWAKPGSASGAQTLVMDTNQLGVRINEKGNFSMRYKGQDFDTDVPATADVWRHIMVIVDGVEDTNNDGNLVPIPDVGVARMYIDGIGEAAALGPYDLSDMANLVLGANTAGGESLGTFTGGTEEFYTGILDDLELFVLGLNQTGSVDFGTFNFKTDNDFAVFTGFPANPVDINGDGTVSGDGTGPAVTDDVTAFVDGWLFENVHNGVRFGDLDTIRSGDINFDGIVDLDDWSLLNAVSPALGAAILQYLAAVPEPGSCLLMVVAGLLGLPALRRKAGRS